VTGAERIYWTGFGLAVRDTLEVCGLVGSIAAQMASASGRPVKFTDFRAVSKGVAEPLAPNSVVVSICHLREALRDVGLDVVVETVKGTYGEADRSYRLDEASAARLVAWVEARAA
jgi:D-arabinose 1-dehydrogenase-like Zn-dependent alcohol dehydrogenase